MNIGERLKLLRKRLELSQETLAQTTGVSLVSLKKYEASKAIPGGEALGNLAKTGVNLNWLLTGEGKMLLSDVDDETGKPLDTERLARMLAIVEDVLAGRHLQLAPDKKARLVGVLYDRETAPKRGERTELNQLLDLIN